MHCGEYHDLLAAHVDGLLTPEEASLVAAHLGNCPRCARLFDGTAKFRDAFRGRTWVRATPAALRRSVMAAIDAEDRGVDHLRSVQPWWPQRTVRLAFAGALALLVLIVGVRMMRSPPPPPEEVLAAIVADFHAIEAHRMALGIETDEPARLRSYYQQAGFEFSNTVMDLEPLGWRVAGGAVVEFAARKSTLTVYQGVHGMLLCHRIPAAGFELPAGGETVDGDTFYTVDGITIRVHRDGDVWCFMASALPRAEFMKHLVQHA